MLQPHSSNFRMITTYFGASEYLGNLRYAESYEHCQPELKKTASWNTADQAKDIASGPKPSLFWDNNRVRGPNYSHAVWAENIPDWVNNQTCSPSNNINDITYSFVSYNWHSSWAPWQATPEEEALGHVWDHWSLWQKTRPWVKERRARRSQRL